MGAFLNGHIPGSQKIRSEIADQRPNSEIRNPKEGRMPNFGFSWSDLGFGFRISAFGFGRLPLNEFRSMAVYNSAEVSPLAWNKPGYACKIISALLRLGSHCLRGRLAVHSIQIQHNHSQFIRSVGAVSGFSHAKE